MYLLAFLVFLANLKLLKLMRFNHRIYLFTKTLSKAALPLFSFLVVFLVFYIAFSFLFYSIYGSVLPEYRSFLTTIETLFSAVMGGFDFETVEANNRLLGPVIFFSFQMVMVMILMNVFLTILMDSFAEVQADEHLKSKDYEVVEYMLQQFKYFFVKTGKVGSVSENDASSGSEVNLTRAANRAQSDGESNACDSTEGNSLEVSEAKEQTAVKHDHGSFSSLRTLLDSTHLRHDAYQDDISTWPSLSLPIFHTHNVDNEEPLPYPGEPVGDETEGQTIDIPAESDHDSSRTPFIVSQSGDDYCGSDSESQYALTECSQSRRCSTVTYPSLDLESSRKTSSDSCSPVDRVETPSLQSEQNAGSSASHYYELLNKAIDELIVKEEKELENKHVALDPDLYYYYELLEDTVRGREREQDTLSEAFSFTNYKVCSNFINAQENHAMDWESCLEVEAKIADLQSLFASVAMSDLHEDEAFEQLLKLYISVLNEFSFEPDSATMESKLVKRFEEKARWKYTRHMYTQA